jgi:hypothetical protein
MKVLLGLAVALVLASVEAPAFAGPPCSIANTTACIAASAAGDGFNASGTTGRGATKATSNRVAETRGDVARPVVATTVTQTSYVPTCSGNAMGGENVLCTAAVETCAAATDTRFWVYTREVNLAGGATPWVLVADPPFVCLGLDDPAVAAAVDPAVAIAGMIQREFQRVVVLKGVAEVSPRPETLVNIPTIFTTDAPLSYDIPLTLLGQPVTITATARKWSWHFGDGATATTTAAGTRGRVEHVYRRAAPLGPYVVIEWSGTYRIGGGSPLPITGTATTTGDPTPLTVRQARTELVDSSR